MVVYLLQVAANRFELYSEQAEGPPEPLDSEAGRFRRLSHAISLRWHQLVDTARRRQAAGRLARWVDEAICRLAESIDEQRTLWELRSHPAATLRYPATLDPAQASATLMASLERERGHHLRWLIIDLVILLISLPLALAPGPNVVSYYFAFRALTHLYSWRGARRAATAVDWRFAPDTALAELVALAGLPREARAPKLEAIAAQLNLPRLAAFFERAAVQSG